MIKMIAAVAEGGVIGRDGGIPWDLPEDRRIFKELTMGNTLIMGRVTYESIGRPLPGRNTIVVTSDPDYPVPHTSDIGRALCIAADSDCFFCGGERIYAEGLKYTEVLYLTRVELAVEGDRFFPADFEKDFHLISRERLSANCTLMTYVR